MEVGSKFTVKETVQINTDLGKHKYLEGQSYWITNENKKVVSDLVDQGKAFYGEPARNTQALTSSKGGKVAGQAKVGK